MDSKPEYERPDADRLGPHAVRPLSFFPFLEAKTDMIFQTWRDHGQLIFDRADLDTPGIHDHMLATHSLPRVVPPELQSALHAVRLAFDDARLSAAFAACPHCYTDRDIAYLQTVAPLEMTDNDIVEICGSLTSTIGSVEDIAYFVPALVDAHFRGLLLEELVLKRLWHIPATDWTGERREALQRAYVAYLAWQPDEGDMMELDGREYRTWMYEMLERPPHSAVRELPDSRVV